MKLTTPTWPTLKRAIFVIGLIVIVVIALSFPFGPLMPWSPISPGYRTESYAHADVLSGDSDPVTSAYKNIDEVMAEAEIDHRLKFNSRLKIIACRNWSDCRRYLPWMNVRVLGGVTLATGDVIYITPRLREKGLDTLEFLRHELSHAVISQNTTILNSYKMVEQGWFAEGMAVSFGRQRAYLTQEEFIRRAAEIDLATVIDPERMNREDPAWSAKMAYVAQRNFVEYLQQEPGREKFQRFLVQYIHNPDDYRRIFQEVFQRSFPEKIAEFQRSIREDRWPSARKESIE